MVAQVIVPASAPDLVRRLILAGTAPAGDQGPAATAAVLQAAVEKAGAQGKHPKHFLFFLADRDQPSGRGRVPSRVWTRRTEGPRCPGIQRDDRCPADRAREVGAGHLTCGTHETWISPSWLSTATTTRCCRRSTRSISPSCCPTPSSASYPGLRPRRHLPAPGGVRGAGAGLPPRLTRKPSAPPDGATAPAPAPHAGRGGGAPAV